MDRIRERTRTATTGSSEFPIEHFKMLQVLNPGGSAIAIRRRSTGSGYTDTTGLRATIHDPNAVNFRLVSETIEARYNPGNARYEAVGSAGLFRHCKAVSNIAAAADGDCTVYSGTGANLEIAQNINLETGAATTNVTIEVRNSWIAGPIAASQNLYARFIPGTLRWWPLPALRPMIRGTLSGDLTASGSQSLSTSNGTFTVYDAMLESGKKHTSGDTVMALLDHEDGKYYVVQSKECPV